MFGNYFTFLEAYQKHNMINCGYYATNEADANKLVNTKFSIFKSHSNESQIQSLVDIISAYGILEIGELFARLINLKIFKW